MKLRHDVREEIVHAGPGAANAFARGREMLGSFRFYHPMVQATVPKGGLAPGALLDQRLHLGPLRIRGLVRVVDVADGHTADGRRYAFTYEAMPGHPEQGTASFDLQQHGDSVRFRIESHSAPRAWWAILGTPVTRAIQKRAVALAFRNVRESCAQISSKVAASPPA